MEKQKMRLIVASNNANKLREFREILGEQFDIVSMREAGIDADIEENGTTFEENALIKANYVMNAGWRWTHWAARRVFTAHAIVAVTATTPPTIRCSCTI